MHTQESRFAPPYPKCEANTERRNQNILRLLLIDAIRNSLRLLYERGELNSEDEPQTEWGAAVAVPTR